MTDQQIEILFKSIENFHEFENRVFSCQDIELNDYNSIRFRSDGKVDIYLRKQKITLLKPDFDSVIKEIIQNKEIQDLNEKSSEVRLLEEKRMNELTKLDDSHFKMEEEYFMQMFSARDTATGNPIYKRRLRIITNLLNQGNTIIIRNVPYNSIEGLVNDYLKNQYGYKSLEDELD